MAQQDVDNARAELRRLRAHLAEAKKNLDDTVVRAEIEGRVGRTNLEVGARVTGTDDLLTTIDRAGAGLCRVSGPRRSSSSLEAEPRIPQADPAGKPALGQVTLPDGTVWPRTGRLDFVAPSLDPPPAPRSSAPGSRILTACSCPASSSGCGS